jgi:hypothetical protein
MLMHFEWFKIIHRRMSSRRSSRSARRALARSGFGESLEHRQLLSASLASIPYTPSASPVAVSTTSGAVVLVQLAGEPAQVPMAPPISSYSILSSPTHGTIFPFNRALGALIYTPAPGFVGTDTFTYDATANGPKPGEPPATSNPATVTITVNQAFVSLTRVSVFTNGRGLISNIELFWSGPLDASLARSNVPYEIQTANRKGSFTGPGSGSLAIRMVRYNVNTHVVRLTPRTFFSKFTNAQLLVHGSGLAALTANTGLPISGNNGPATDATRLLRQSVAGVIQVLPG